MWKISLLVLIFASVAGSAGAATVAHWNFEPATGYPADKAYDWGNGGWLLDIGPSGQIVNNGLFGNALKNIGGAAAAPGSVAKVTNNYFTPAQGIKGSVLESVFAGTEWTIEMFVRFDEQPTTWPAHIFYIGNTQLDFHSGFKDVMGIFWNSEAGSINYLQQRVGLVANSANHSRPSSTVDQMAFADGGWHHAAHSLKAGRDYIYIDGFLIDSDPFQGDPSDGYEASGNPMVSVLTSVQTVGQALGQPLMGSVDEIRISDVGLYTDSFNIPDAPFPTPSPIPTGQTPTPTPTPEPTPTPAPILTVAAYDFDVPPGTATIPDVSGNGFDLTVGTAGAITADGLAGNCITNTVGQNGAARSQVATRHGIDETLLDEAFTGPFTVEMWLRINIDDATRVNGHDDWATFFWCGSGASRNNALWLIHKGDHNGLTVFLPAPPGGSQFRLDAGTQQLVQGEWVHYAVCMDEQAELTAYFSRAGGTGTRIARVPGQIFNTAGFSTDSNPLLDVLSYDDGSDAQYFFPGSIDNLRISKGVRYRGGSYTAPTSLSEVTPTPVPGVTRIEFQSGVSPTASYDMEMAYLHVATDGSEGNEVQSPVVTTGETRSYNRWIIGQVDQYGGTNRVLFRWNFDTVPADSDITSATMRIWFGALRDEGNGVFPNPVEMTLYEVTPANGSWTQETASWNYRDAATTTTWSGGATGAGTGGTDYVSTPLATLSFPWNPGVDVFSSATDDVSYDFTFDLNNPNVKEAFQRILSDTNNYGWVMKTNFEVDADGAASTLYLTWADFFDDTVDDQIPPPPESPLEHYLYAQKEFRPLMIIEYAAPGVNSAGTWHLFE